MKLVGLQSYDWCSLDHLASDTERILNAMNSSLSLHKNNTASHNVLLSIKRVLGKVFFYC